MKNRINWHDRMFFEWIFVAIVTILFQNFGPQYNMGILIAVLMIPMFIHDILINLKKQEKKNKNNDK